MPEMDYTKLLQRAKSRNFTRKELAKRAGLSESHFSQKLSGHYVFRQTEMQAICEALDIPADEIGAYFFSPKS